MIEQADAFVAVGGGKGRYLLSESGDRHDGARARQCCPLTYSAPQSGGAVEASESNMEEAMGDAAYGDGDGDGAVALHRGMISDPERFFQC